MWNACDYVLQFNFYTAYIAESISTAVDLLSRFELEVTEKIRLQITEDIQKTLIEVTKSSFFADEGRFFFTQTDNESESKKQILQRKEQSRQNAMEWVADRQPSKSTTGAEKTTKNDGNDTSYSMN